MIWFKGKGGDIPKIDKGSDLLVEEDNDLFQYKMGS